MSLQQPLPRRTVLSASMRNAFCVFPGLVNLFQGNAANAADSQQPPVGHRSEMVQVGQKKVPLELWFPLQKEWQSTDGAKSRIAEYPYSVSITKLFRLLAKRNVILPLFFSNLPPPPSPRSILTHTHPQIPSWVRVGSSLKSTVPIAQNNPPIPAELPTVIFCHGYLG